MENVESNVIQDVVDYLYDATDHDGYFQCGLKPYGCDLWSLLFEEPNANGTLDFNREKSHQYLIANPKATDYIIQQMQDEYGTVSWEDLYEYDEETDEYVESSYIEDNAEAIKVTLFIEIGQTILQQCPTVNEHWNETLDMDDPDIFENIHQEIAQTNLSEIQEYL